MFGFILFAETGFESCFLFLIDRKGKNWTYKVKSEERKK